jgi:hypothetical protein
MARTYKVSTASKPTAQKSERNKALSLR